MDIHLWVAGGTEPSADALCVFSILYSLVTNDKGWGSCCMFTSPRSILKPKCAEPVHTEDTGLALGIYLRLGHSSNPKAHQASEDQDPAVHRRESTEDTVVQGPEHADLQPLWGGDTGSQEP